MNCVPFIATHFCPCHCHLPWAALQALASGLPCLRNRLQSCSSPSLWRCCGVADVTVTGWVFPLSKLVVVLFRLAGSRELVWWPFHSSILLLFSHTNLPLTSHLLEINSSHCQTHISLIIMLTVHTIHILYQHLLIWVSFVKWSIRHVKFVNTSTAYIYIYIKTCTSDLQAYGCILTT